MQRKVLKSVTAIAAAVSCLMGTGAFTSFLAEEGIRQKESEQALIQTEAGAIETETETESEPVHISWWICPTGGYDDEQQVEALAAAFEKANPGIEVDFRILDERTGADEIDAALAGKAASEGESGEDTSNKSSGSDGEDAASGGISGSGSAANLPDVVLAPPEYIVTKWGQEGLMADLTALWDEETVKEFRSEMRDASKNRSDVYYAVPLYRDLYTMAINYDMFRKAGALQYLDEPVHSWKDSGFIDAVLRVHDVLVQEGGAEDDTEESGIVGKVYCRDQAGQRAFMCFVSNFFKTGIVDDYRSSYQVGKGKIREVFTTLRKLNGKGIEFAPEMNGDDENEAFLRGDLFMTFNWSAAKQKAAGPSAQVPLSVSKVLSEEMSPAEKLYGGLSDDAASKEDIKDDKAGDSKEDTKDYKAGDSFHIYPMMYPNSKNVPTLTGPVGSLGVVKTDDGKKMDAAVSFVQYLMSDEDVYRQAVMTAGCFPARRTINGHDLNGLYGDDEVMTLYETLNEYYDTYDPTMELYPQLEEAWPQVLQEIADGAKLKSILTDLQDELNEKLEEEYGIKEIAVEEE